MTEALRKEPQSKAVVRFFNVDLDFVPGPVRHTNHNGIEDDLLSGGLGLSGLMSETPPTFANPERPTPSEVRRRTIYFNYRLLVDMSEHYYGKEYGPGVGVPDGSELIAGDEYIAYAVNGKNNRKTTMMVQIPADFDLENPCILTAPSSGSRGVYGAIAAVGEWGLKNRCAVAYTDKGTGMGVHDLASDTVLLMTGECLPAGEAGEASSFTVPTDALRLEDYVQEHPGNVAFKHAHAGHNHQRYWGEDVLDSIRFALAVLNEKYGDKKTASRFTPDNTQVIASGVSNAGSASIMAAERDSEGLIDAVCVANPNVNPVYDPNFAIRQGKAKALLRHSRPLLDYTTLVNLYLPAAVFAGLSQSAPDHPLCEIAKNRCLSLKEKGLLAGGDPLELAEDAWKTMHDYGILKEHDPLAFMHLALQVPQGISVTFANQYGRFHVTDNLCGFGFSAIDNPATGKPVPLTDPQMAALFSDANGCVPTGGIFLINMDALEGPVENTISVSKSTGRMDLNVDGALRLRRLATGIDERTGKKLVGKALEDRKRVQTGMAEIQVSGKLRGLPAMIVNGRSDAILPPNHTSRPYFGLSRRVDKESRLNFYEVTNAHHLDFLNPMLAAQGMFLVPLHLYFLQALDMMRAHLTKSAPLPPSQVIRTAPEQPLPGISPNPETGDRIGLEGDILVIPG